MNNTSRRKFGGFTLIELLVVVAIIALLLAILLPSLERAREQGRITVCLSNQKGIGTASVQYLLEDKSNDLPWVIPFGYKVAEFPAFGAFALATEFIWGGGMPDRTAQQSQQAGLGNLANSDVWRLPPRFRPMNKYLFPGVSFDSADRDTVTARLAIPMNLPGVFKCPSDRSPWVPGLGSANPEVEADTVFPAWEYWGTSYPSNWYWSNYYQLAPEPPPYNSAANALGLYLVSQGIRGIGNKMMQKTAGGWESRFITFYESQFNYAMENAKPPGFPNSELTPNYYGWHKQLNYHTATYRDGHSDYRLRDTRYTEGPGWTTWPNRPWTGTLKDY